MSSTFATPFAVSFEAASSACIAVVIDNVIFRAFLWRCPSDSALFKGLHMTHFFPFLLLVQLCWYWVRPAQSCIHNFLTTCSPCSHIFFFLCLSVAVSSAERQQRGSRTPQPGLLCCCMVTSIRAPPLARSPQSSPPIG